MLVTCTPDDFSSPLLVFARLCALVGNTRTAEQLVESHLFDQLSPSIGGSFELLDELLSVSLIVKNLSTELYVRPCLI